MTNFSAWMFPEKAANQKRITSYGIIRRMQPFIVGVRFNSIGKTYHFDSSKLRDIKVGEYVIVVTARGKHLGEVIQILEKPPAPPNGGWKPVERRATPRDLLLRESWQSKQAKALIECQARASELELIGVKIVAAEYNYDGSRLTFLFSTESDEKVDLKSLKKDMRRKFSKPQIDLRQIGPRDVAKIIGGMGACGLEARCCSKFLTNFNPISIKMAKEQGISLTPSEITGMCGRLRCCLLYEFDQYVQARKKLPRRKKRVITPNGEGIVVDIAPLSGMVTVKFDGEPGRLNRQTFHRDDIDPWNESEALRRKAQNGCDRHPEGGCNCQKENDRKKE